MENNRALINRLSEEIDQLKQIREAYRQRIDMLEQVIENKDLTICKLNTKLCKAEGKLDKIQNYIRMTEGREFK